METFCCEMLKHAINCNFISQIMANGERSVAIWEAGEEAWDIKFCPFCGTYLSEDDAILPVV